MKTETKSKLLPLLIVLVTSAALVLTLMVGLAAAQEGGPEGERQPSSQLRAPNAPAAPMQATAMISNGVVLLGVNELGELIVPGGPPSPVAGETRVGLRYVPTGNEAVSHGGPYEGWGVADALSSVSGWVNQGHGSSGLALNSFVTTASTARSVVSVGTMLSVTHDYHPSLSPNLYQVDVVISNTLAVSVDLRYRRVVDWDIEPTVFSEYVTVDQGTASALFFTSNAGFAHPNPLSGPSDEGYTGTFVDAGPLDHGALFDFDFGSLAPGAARRFTLYYGAAKDEAEAVMALYNVGAEAYAFGQPSTPAGPTQGTPNTFILAFAGVGGAPVVPHGVHLAPAAAKEWAEPGSRVVYTETLANLTGVSDSFALAVSGNAWPTALSVANTGVLPDGAAVDVTVQVDVPPGANASEHDQVTVVANSIGGLAFYSDTATLTTTALSDQRGYATAPDSDRVWVVDPVVGAPVQSIDVSPYGQDPRALELSPDGRWLYVGLYESDSVLVIDTTTHTPLTPTIPVGDGPVAIAFTPDGSQALVANAGSPDSLTIIDTAALTVTATLDGGFFNYPGDVAVNGCTGLAYVANQSGGSVVVVDTTVPTVTAVIPGFDNPLGIVIAPDGQKAYVTEQGDGTVGVVDLAHNVLLDSWDVGSWNINALDISPDGRWLYVVDNQSLGLHVIDASNGRWDAFIPLPTDYWIEDVQVSPDGKRIFVARGYDDVVSVVDAASRTVVGSIGPVGRYVYRLAFYPPAYPCLDGIQVEKSTVPAAVEAGEPFTCTINYLYTGTLPIDAAALLDVLPAGATLLSASGNPQVEGNRVVWPLGTLNDGSSGSQSLTAVVGLVTTDTAVLTNTAWGAPLGQVARAPVVIAAPTRGVALDPTASEASTLAVYSATHTIAVYNVGTAGVDSFALDILGADPGWTYTINDGHGGTALIDGTGPISTFEALLLDVRVWPPAGAPAGALDLATLQVTSNADPSKSASAALTSHVARPGYVFNMNNKINVVDTLAHLDTGIAIDTGPYGGVPLRGALSPDGQWLYAGLLGRDGVLVVDTATLSPVTVLDVGGGPHGVAFSADGAYAFVANQWSDDVSVIDTSVPTVTVTLPVSDRPMSVASSPCLNKVYVTNRDSDSVSVIDAGTLTVTAVITGFFGPWDVVVSPGGDRAYVTNQDDGSIGVIDTASDSLAGTWDIGGVWTPGLDISPDGRTLYVADARTGMTYAVDAFTGQVIAMTRTSSVGVTWEVEAFPAPAGPFAYVSNPYDGEVKVVDMRTNRVVGTIPLGGTLRGMALFPARTVCGASPKAAFTPAQSIIRVGGTVDFTNLSTGMSPLAYTWDFGDGSPPSDAVDPSHAFSRVGTYTVVLTATNPIHFALANGQVRVDHGLIYLPVVMRNQP